MAKFDCYQRDLPKDVLHIFAAKTKNDTCENSMEINDIVVLYMQLCNHRYKHFSRK